MVEQSESQPLEYQRGETGDGSFLCVRALGPIPDRDKPICVVARGWRRVGVLYGDAKHVRFVVLEPHIGDGETRFPPRDSWPKDLYVDGRFRVAKSADGPKAREAFEAFEPA